MVNVLTCGKPSGASRRACCSVKSRPGGGTIFPQLRAALQLVHDAGAFAWAIAAGMPTARQVIQGGQSALIEPTDQTGDRIVDFPAYCSGRIRQALARIDGQQGHGSLMAHHGFTWGTTHTLQFTAFGFSQGTKGLGDRTRHRDGS